MLAAEINDNLLVGVLLAFIPLGAAFLAWVVRELARITENNGRTAEKLAHMGERLERLEDAVWRTAWTNASTITPKEKP